MTRHLPAHESNAIKPGHDEVAGHDIRLQCLDHFERFDRLLRHYRALPLPDQIVLRRSLLWNVLGLRASDTGRGGGLGDANRPARGR